MKRNHSIVAATLGTVTLAAAFTLTGAGAANATTTDPDSPDAASQSCWIDASTQQSLCVATGDDLLAAVQELDGITIQVPVGAVVSGNAVTNAQSVALSFNLNAAATTIATSELFDDINYGGGDIIMTSDTGCDAAVPSLVPYGWNDRASSFKSFNGCLTALYQNINYGGTKVGYASSKSSFGSQNDQGSSWETGEGHGNRRGGAIR